MVDWHKAIRSRKLHTGEVSSARAGDETVMVARLSNGQAVAFANRCPHQDTDLKDATVWRDNIRCPRHVYLYDPSTGINVEPTNRVRPDSLWRLKPGYLPVYPVEERDGWIWVSPEPLPPPEAWDPALEQRPEGAAAVEVGEDAFEEITPGVMVTTVEVPLGASFELGLPTNPLPGHTWDVNVPGDLLEIMDEGLLDSDPPRWRVQMAALSEGEEEIRCEFRAPWDRDPSAIRRYVVRVLPPD